MKKYVVSIPIAGALHIAVDADSKDAAIEAAWEKFNNSEYDAEDDVEWEALEHITTGNVIHTRWNDVEVSGGQ